MVVTCTSLYFLSRVFYLIVYILIVYIDSFFVSSSSLPRLVYVMCHVNESALPYYPLISELKKNKSQTDSPCPKKCVRSERLVAHVNAAYPLNGTVRFNSSRFNLI